MKYFERNGCLYHGEVDELGVPSGKGRCRWPNGNVYVGDFLSGTTHGVGELRFIGGNRYEGAFVAGQISGYGKLWKKNRFLIGNFKDGYLHGRGMTINSAEIPKTIYEGEFADGLRSGRGKIIRGSSRYEGIFEDGRLVSGTFESPDGIFTGDFENETPSDGTLKLKNEDAFFGTFRNEKRGQLVKAESCDLLDGCFDDDWNLEGTGIIYRNGSVDENEALCYSAIEKGEFKKSKLHGKGRITNEAGILKGTFVNGEIDHGMMKYVSGGIYVGDFIAGKPHGKGNYYAFGESELNNLDKIRYCHNCSNTNESKSRLNRCWGCRYAQYCNKECQLADWEKHKEVCKIVKRCRYCLRAGKEKYSRCSGCDCRYCDETCSLADWSRHKHECKEYAKQSQHEEEYDEHENTNMNHEEYEEYEEYENTNMNHEEHEEYKHEIRG